MENDSMREWMTLCGEVNISQPFVQQKKKKRRRRWWRKEAVICETIQVHQAKVAGEKSHKAEFSPRIPKLSHSRYAITPEINSG